MKPDEFIAMLKPHAMKVQNKFFIPWQVIVAQAAWETGWLAHPTIDKHSKKDSHNLFNIKADASWEGPTVTVNTWEVVGGNKVAIEAKFRAYSSYTEALGDYAQFLLRNPRYKKAFLHVKDPIRFIHEVAAAGYATDPRYAEGISSIIKTRMKGA